IEMMSEHVAEFEADYIVGIESRGFIFAMPVAHQLALGFVPIRKAGKLPRAVHSVAYSLEYGEDRLEVHKDAFHAGSKVVIMDDLLATGGTAAAAASLVETAGAKVVGFSFLIELEGLAGREKLPAAVPAMSLITY
ncbi:MAG: adenine phosphoribosyltransferase, partial [Cyanobacteria bacterium J06607_10]